MPKPHRNPTDPDAIAASDASAETNETDLKEGERRRAGELPEGPKKGDR